MPKIKKVDIFLIFILSLLLPLFFFKLGQSSLTSFDEAWYAAIARNILREGDIFNLVWNGRPFADHPPAGFWLIALTFKLFGVSEFWARFAPALLGYLTLIILYLLGKELFNRLIGFTSAVAFSSSPWFIFRARSGNLDTILTFFFILSLYLAVKAAKDKRYFIPLSFSLVFLFLTKTLVPFSIIPALIVIFWKSKALSWENIKIPLFIFLTPVLIWLVSQFINYEGFIQRYFKIGLPQASLEPSFLENLKLVKTYLHNGIGKWFWPGMFSLFLGLLTRKKTFLILFIFFAAGFLPFLFSQKGHIWHLIPLHPIMILSFLGVSYIFLEKLIKRKILIALILIFLVFYVSFLQIKSNWYEFIDIPAFISDEEILSEEARNYPHKFYIDGQFVPAAVFYSEKKVVRIDRGDLIKLFEGKEPFLLITHQWRLEEEGVGKGDYEILSSDRDKILILRK